MGHTLTIKKIFFSSCPLLIQQYVLRVKNSPLGYRLAAGVFWALAGTVISRGLAVVSSVIVARILGKEGFGELGIIQSTIGMFGVFAGFGLGLTATKYVAEFRARDPQKAGRIIALSNVVAFTSGGLIALGLVFAAPWLAVHTLAAPHLKGLLQIGALLLLFSAICGAQTGALSGFEAFKTIAKINFWSGIASFLFIVIGVIYADLKGALFGQIMGMFVIWILNHIALKQEAPRAGVPCALSGWEKELPILWHYSLPALLSGILVGPVTWACNAILVNKPNGYAEMGVFNAANQWRLALIYLSGILMSPLIPVLSSEKNSMSKNFQSALKNTHAIVTLVTVSITLVMMMAAHLIMKTYGSGFESGQGAFVLLIAATAISTIGSPAGISIQAQGKMWLGFWMNLSWAALLLTSYYFVTINAGAFGLSFSYLISYLILTFCGYGYLYRSLPTGMFRRTFISCGFILIIALLSTLIFKN
jgi:O-antigen/teichoic acid export membrane protein